MSNKPTAIHSRGVCAKILKGSQNWKYLSVGQNIGSLKYMLLSSSQHMWTVFNIAEEMSMLSLLGQVSTLGGY